MDIIEILINKRTKGLALDIPEAGMSYQLSLGKELSSKDLKEYIPVAQINIDEFLEKKENY